MIIHIPPEIVNKHRLLTKNEIDSYNLAPHLPMLNEAPSGYIDNIFIDQQLGVPCFINTNENIDNANKLNENHIFYVKGPSILREPYMYSLFIKHEPEKTHDLPGGKSKKRKTNKSKKSKKNKTNKK
jgi:hypothetical protein